MNYENVKLQSTNYKNVLKTHFQNIRTVRLTFSMEGQVPDIFISLWK